MGMVWNDSIWVGVYDFFILICIFILISLYKYTLASFHIGAQRLGAFLVLFSTVHLDNSIAVRFGWNGWSVDWAAMNRLFFLLHNKIPRSLLSYSISFILCLSFERVKPM